MRRTALRQRVPALLALAVTLSACGGYGLYVSAWMEGAGPEVRFDGPRVEPHLAGRFRIVRNLLPPSHAGDAVVALGDCDGDGLGDLVRQDGSVWRGVGEDLFTPIWQPDRSFDGAALAAHLGDLDGDGAADLVLAGRTTTVFSGDGACHFSHARTLIPADARVWAAQVQAADVDLDGLADLAVTQTGAQSTAVRIFLARGDGTYEEAPLPQTPYSLADVEASGLTGFASFIHDVDGDGAPDLFAAVDRGASWFSWGVPDDAPRFARDDTISRLVAAVDAMGVAPLDVDRDGRQDFFVSGELTTRLLWNRAPRDVVNLGHQAAALHHGDDVDWGAYAFDADRDGWQDLLVLHLTDGEEPAPASLFLNRHDVTFRDAGPKAIGASFGAKALACGDLRGRGLPDCFVDDRAGAVLLVNELQPQGNWLGVQLVGHVSAAEPLGAELSLDGEERPLVQLYGGGAPTFATHRPEPLLSLGSRKNAALRITWPSGLVTRHEGLAANGWVRLEEPQVLRLSTRLAPADGRARVEVVVSPPQGEEVAIERTGAGTWEDEARRAADGTWRRVLVAPAHAGASRIAVLLDGKALRVRPRVRFE